MQIIRNLIITLVISITACSSTNKTMETTFSELNIGYGGGATGFINGYMIDSTGQLFQWSGRLMKDNIKRLATIPSDSLKVINEIISQGNLKDINYQQPGNMYRFFQIKSDTISYYIAWGYQPDNDIEKKLNAIYDKIFSIINNFK